MMILIIKTLYFFLPAYFANMAPVVACALNLPLGRPISEKLFGKNKTLRGFVAGFFAALITLFIQRLIVDDFEFVSNISYLDYGNISILSFAFAFGIGALTGDLIKSFFKRRLNKKPGSFWFPFDQIDFVVGAFVFLYPMYSVPFKMIVVLIIFTPVLHLTTNVCAYILGLKKVWW